MKITVKRQVSARPGLGVEDLPDVVHEAAAIAVRYQRLGYDAPPQLLVALMNPGKPGVHVLYDAVGTIICSGDTW